MTRFDKNVKRAAKNFKVPESYEKRVEETIQSLTEDDVSFPCERPKKRYKGMLVFVCACLIFVALFSTAEVTQAGFLEMFRETIIDFLGIEKTESESMGIASQKDNAVSKPDLLIELQEKVIDSQNIYLIVKVTAPADIEFRDHIGFDYFAFAEGSNYNSEYLLPGARDCQLLEVLKGKSNIATYIVNLSSTQELQEGMEVTAFFKDLVDDPQSDHPNVLVEGMWSVTFVVEPTVSEEIVIKGTPEMSYRFLDMNAKLEKLHLTPLGLTIVADISEVDHEQLGFADTSMAIRLKMIDNSELPVSSHDTEAYTITNCGSYSFEETDANIWITATYQFDTPISVAQVSGIYLEDYYLSFRE